MVSPDGTDSNQIQKYRDLQNRLNLDEETARKAWESFIKIHKKCILEGDVSHWFGCAVYAECRLQTMTTVARREVVGNCVSLTSLLRYCNLSLAQFFNKIRRWIDMNNLSEEFKQIMNNLQDNIAITYNLFKKYCVIFVLIFKEPNDTEPRRHHRNRRQRTLCTPTQVFELCWLLFITGKSKNFASSPDLVTSFHFLQACCDLAFRNAFLDDRRDLLNPQFAGLPNNWSDSNYEVPNDAPCIINILSSEHEDMITDAKYVKEYACKAFIKKLFKDKTLHGKEDNFSELFTPSNFDSNFRSVEKLYEEQLLSKGDFDERIFLAEYKRRLLLKENATSNGNVAHQPFSETGDTNRIDLPGTSTLGEIPQRAPVTPLTGRCYLAPKDSNEVTPLSTATRNVTVLHTLLNGRTPAPSSTLIQIFTSCSVDPTETISDVLKNMGEKFCAAYIQQDANSEVPQVDYANKRLEVAITFFYKLLEEILQNEKKKRDQISSLLLRSVFYESLLACCLEIVIYSYNSQRQFPWILNAVEISEFYFVRVIELVVRSEDLLSRDIVKHLNMMEETILESYMWKSDGLLWKSLSQLKGEIPKYEDIALPKNILHNSNATVKTESVFQQNNNIQPGPSVVETFQSPMAQVKKQLFPMKTNQTVMQQKPTHIIFTDTDGNRQLFPLVDSSVLVTRPKKSGSICLIFRKFYNLAAARMEDLCKHLEIDDIEFKCTIWTVFEYSIRHTDYLMKDRHLDQLLMCAIYVSCRVTENNDKNFTTIMKYYRYQPQAESKIYRDVLLKKLSDTELTRGDLISFYNNIYRYVIKQFALQFAKSSNQNTNLLLSPIPYVKSIMASPKQQIGQNVFIKPYESPSTQPSAGQLLNYCFNRSASKDLEAINVSISKRKLNETFEVESSNERLSNRKVQKLMEERRVQNME